MPPHAEELEFIFEFKAPEKFDDAYYFVFSQGKVLAQEGESNWRPLELAQWQKLEQETPTQHHFGLLFGMPCFAVEVPSAPPGFRFISMWELANQIDKTRFAIVGRALQIVTWEQTHQHCGQCGKPTQPNAHECSRTCKPCNLTFYPKLSPAIIVLVTHGDELLLARGTRMPEGFYSTLAGFVEPGESLEQAVHREVFEEVGIKIKNLRYFKSQPWPFPHSLMVGFFAEYESGELVLQESEIAEAHWFHFQNLPHRPRHISISGWLIEDFVERKRHAES